MRIYAIWNHFAVSPNGDLVGKLTVGYQGWFSCKGDDSPRNTWVHWVDWNNQNNIPMPVKQKFETCISAVYYV